MNINVAPEAMLVISSSGVGSFTQLLSQEAVFTVEVLSELNYLGDSSISEAVLTLTGFLRVKLSWR